jgi:hypothetical protein
LIIAVITPESGPGVALGVETGFADIEIRLARAAAPEKDLDHQCAWTRAVSPVGITHYTPYVRKYTQEMYI